MAYPGPWERLGIMFVAGCHDADVLRQSAFPKNERASAQNSAFASNNSLRPFNGKSNYLRTSTHRAKIRNKQDTNSFSCRDWPMIMNSIEGLQLLCVAGKLCWKSLIFRLFCCCMSVKDLLLADYVSNRFCKQTSAITTVTVPRFHLLWHAKTWLKKSIAGIAVHMKSWLELLK